MTFDAMSVKCPLCGAFSGRRSFITLMDMRGVPRAVGMEKSGHKSEAVYRRYRIVAPTEFRQAWLTMEAGRQAELAELASRRGNYSVVATTPKV